MIGTRYVRGMYRPRGNNIRKHWKPGRRTVEAFKEIHSGSNHSDLGFVVRDPETEPSPQEEDGQEGEREEQEHAATPAIDGENCGQSEYPVQDAGTHRGQQCVCGRVSGLDEDGGAVVCNDIHTAELSPSCQNCSHSRSINFETHLLTKHDNPTGPGGAAVARDGEEFNELREQVLPLEGLALQFDPDVGIVGVSCRLEVTVSKTLERPESLFRVIMLDVPSTPH